MSESRDPSSAVTNVALRPPRDARLDFWRGLCLIDMVLVHLIVQGLEIGHFAHAVLGEYTRFAAGGFIFVAGLSVGRIYLPKARQPALRRSAYRALLWRALYILAVHYTATLGFMLFAVLRDEPLPPVAVVVIDILLLREGYDLLPFYVVMIALSPLLLEAVRRGWGAVVALVSAGLFIWGRDHYAIEAIPIQQTFFVVLWQVVFVMGLLAGAAFPAYDALRPRAKLALASAACAVTLGLSVLAYGWHFHLPKFHFLWFTKVPLSGGEAMRYLAFVVAVITVTDVLWRFIAGTRVESFVARLGRRSLAMYVTHVVVVGLLVPISYRIDVPLILQLAYFPVAALMLWGVARAMDALRDRATHRAHARTGPTAARRRAIWRFRGWPIAATAAVVVIALAIWSHLKPLPPGQKYDERPYDEPRSADPSVTLDTVAPRFLSPVAAGILRPAKALDG